MQPFSSMTGGQRPFSESLWYRALTLSERIAALRASSQDAMSCKDEQLIQAAKRLEQWKHQLAFRDSDLFAERLAMDAITESELVMLLAEPIEDLYQRFRDQPAPVWIAQLQYLWEMTPQREEAQSPGPLEFVDVLKPLIEMGYRLLRQGMETFQNASQDLPFDIATVHQLFLANLHPRLQQVVQRALILEMHIARLEERLAGDTPQERFNNFLQQCCQPTGFYAFLSTYPLLARNVLIIVQQWADYSLEIMHHLATDWNEIGRLFMSEGDLGNLVEVRTGAGDTHCGGRSVAILRFSSGFQLVYKPRSLALDQHFQEMVVWMNALGLAQPLRVLTILEAGDHGWVEFVQAQECSTQAEVSHFYERQGSYLALLYALDATDFHFENVIAVGEHPVLVDLEALFHAHLEEDEKFQREDAAARSIGYSVYRTGLLPFRMQPEAGGMGLDISGLGGKEGQLIPWLVPTWKERGTDQMRVMGERREIPAGQNRPKFLEQEVEIVDYSTDILRGFTEMYRLLMSHQEEWLTQILPRFEQDDVRIILRSTQTYTTLLSESFHPKRLGNALERERLFDALWGDVSSQPYLRQVIAAERIDLMQGDVPLFTTQPGSRDLFTSQGERLANFCSVTGMEGVRQRIKAMNESDLALQQWIIQASLATTLMGEKQIPLVPLYPSSSQVSSRQLLQLASSIGERLENLAVHGEQGVNWLGVGVIAQSEGEAVWQLQAHGWFLYDGLAGIILFLSYLGKLTGEQNHLVLANLALSTLEEQIAQKRASHHPQEIGIGAFAGLGSLIYLYSHLSVLHEEKAFLQRAQAIVEEVASLIEQDNVFDLIGGSAGCVLCLLGFYHLAPSPRTLEVTIRCGEHLLASAHELAGGLGWYAAGEETALAGCSHGTAGIALSLFQLAQMSQQERFHQAALAALAYERSLFSPEQGNWPRLTVQGEPAFSVSWCHGAPGIGLARLASLPFHDDALMRQEIQIALATTLKSGFGRNQSLCHGDLGNLETLLTASRVLNEPSYQEACQNLTAQICNGIQEHGWVTGVPLGVETPGLMTGLAGIGYELLRLAAPQSVPSVLVLAPPVEKLKEALPA